MANGLDEAFEDVREFHLAFDCAAPEFPQMQSVEDAGKRANWIAEEVRELRDARTIEDQADAYIDILYFAIGGLVEIGLRPLRLWKIVHGANMAKLWPDGKPRRRQDGKIIKPPGWVPPELELTIVVLDQSRRVPA